MNARNFSTAFGAVYVIVGVLGFVIEGTSANILALNVWDQLLHLATAGFAFLAVSTGRTAAASA